MPITNECAHSTCAAFALRNSDYCIACIQSGHDRAQSGPLWYPTDGVIYTAPAGSTMTVSVRDAVNAVRNGETIPDGDIPTVYMTAGTGGAEDWDSITERLEAQQAMIESQQALISSLAERLANVEGAAGGPADRRTLFSSVEEVIGAASSVLRPDPYTVTMAARPPRPDGPQGAETVESTDGGQPVPQSWLGQGTPTQNQTRRVDEIADAYDAAMAGNMQRTAVAR